MQKAVPPSLKAGFEIRKLVCDEQLVRQRILEYLKATHLAAAAFIKGEDISVRTGEPTVFVFGVDEAEKTFFETRNILENVAAMLEKNFCAQFRGELELKEKPVEDTEIEEEDEPGPLSGDAHLPDRRFRGDRFCRSSSNGYLYEGLFHGGG